MNTRNKSDKAEIDKTYREAIQATPKPSNPPKPPLPQYTSTPYIPAELNSPELRKLLSDSPLSVTAFGLPPQPLTQPPVRVLEKTLEKAQDIVESLEHLEKSPEPPPKNPTKEPLGVPGPSTQSDKFLLPPLEKVPKRVLNLTDSHATRYHSLRESTLYSFRLAVTESEIQSHAEVLVKPMANEAEQTQWKTALEANHTRFANNPEIINNSQSNVNETEMNNESAMFNTHGSLHYAVGAVPHFDGQNIPVEFFIEGCEMAKSMIPPESEIWLTKIIHSRLSGEARRSLQDNKFSRINQLTNFLKNLFGSSKGLYELQAELGRVYQRPEEKIVAYANRVKAVGKRILEAHVDSNGKLDPNFQTTVEKEMCNSFTKGLKPELEQRMPRNLGVTEAVQEALRIEKELQSISELRGVPTLTPAVNTQTCQICKKSNHTAETCRFLQNTTNLTLGNEILICQICKKRGHSADKCRFRESSASAPVKLVQDNLIICHNCNKTGHIAQNCRSLNNRPNIICYNCQKPGHISKECRSKLSVSNNINTITCQLCNKTGHNAKNCYSNPNRNNTNNGEICQWCERRGHSASQCRQRQNQGQPESLICQICNKIGHKARECRQSIIFQNNSAVQNALDQCRYCKATGHLIENCVLRLENNRRRQGNSLGSPTMGANRGTNEQGRQATLAQIGHETIGLLK